MRRALFVLLAACGTSAVAGDAPPAPPPAEAPPPPLPPADAGNGVLEWPNTESFAISDAWIAAHHDAIGVMRPRVLAINFDESRPKFHENVQRVIDGLNEGSRHLGYAKPEAPRFLAYTVAKWVDMADDPVPSDWKHRYSTKVRARCGITDAFYQFDYSSLLSDDFTRAFGAPLCDMLAKGDVHEIWIHMDGDPDPYDCADGSKLASVGFAEVLESKKVKGGFDTCAGNGCFGIADGDAFAACGRTVRVLYINSTRGPGCAIHSLGHGFESTARRMDLPGFLHFANFDLRERFGTPFEDWYGCSDPDCLTWTGDNSLTWKIGGVTGKIAKFDQGCGNVHFAPNARAQYDENDTTVLATCAGETPQPFSKKSYAAYDAKWDDCGGGWQIYWRQSFPGLGSKHNWWPYLFY